MTVVHRVEELLEATRFRTASSDLERKIGHRFKDQSLLKLALTHRSVGRQNYERLEFVGDKILASVITHELYQRVNKQEKDLSRLYNHLTSNESLAEIARSIGIGEHIQLSAQERKDGGAAKMNILADVVEALIGAVHIDAGHRKAEAVVKKLWNERLEKLSETAATNLVDPKSRLQEVSQALGLGIPMYINVDKRGPDHNPVFTVEVKVGNKSARGRGDSKKKAEQEAAKALLGHLPSSKLRAKAVTSGHCDRPEQRDVEGHLCGKRSKAVRSRSRGHRIT